MSIVEHNDVEISPLFNWGKEFVVLGSNDEPLATLYMRLVGDADLNKARVYALRKSAEKRKALLNEDSDDRVAFIVDKESLDKDKLVGLCTLFASKDLAKQAVKEVKIPIPKEPKSDAPLEKFEKYQKEIDDYPKKREEALRKYITTRVEQTTDEFSKNTIDELYVLYVNYVIDELCEEEMLNSFKDMCTYLGTYKDDTYTTKFFKSFDEFMNLDSYLKQQFVRTYADIDITADDLKKLQRATQ